MGDPDFLRLLAEPRFPDMKSWQLTRKSERFEMYLAQLSHTLRNAVREQQDDAERRSIGAGLTYAKTEADGNTIYTFTAGTGSITI